MSVARVIASGQHGHAFGGLWDVRGVWKYCKEVLAERRLQCLRWVGPL